MDPTNNKLFIVDRYFCEMQKVLTRRLLKEQRRQQQTEDDDKYDTSDSDTLPVLYGRTGQRGLSIYPTTPQLNTQGHVGSAYLGNGKICNQLEDLLQLPGPLTEHAILRTLQARFYANNYCTHIGPVLVSINPWGVSPGGRALTSPCPPPPHYQALVRRSLHQLAETSHSQALVLDGISGSGKTQASLQLLRLLFEQAGGGAETDAFKHLNAALTVLRALTTAGTVANNNSSRMGYFTETHIADGAITRTKLHCYFMDQNRVTEIQTGERNFHIFYQMLAGLSDHDLEAYHLTNHSAETLAYLAQGNTSRLPTEEQRDYFEAWRSCLAVLGIPLDDIMRVLAAVLLLGNIHFMDTEDSAELKVQGQQEIKLVASLLGMSGVTLYQGLTTMSRPARGQIFKTTASAFIANQRRDSLAKALYCRTVAAIVKRANSSRRPQSTTASTSDLQDSMNGGHMTGPSSPALSRTSSFSMPGKSFFPNTPSAYIGILDMFGFETLKVNQLEQLCINLTAESLQHFYNTHLFKTTEEACIEEGIQADMDVYYFENAPIVELISSQRTGILSLLEAECRLQKGSTEAYLHKVRVQHQTNPHFKECPGPADQASFMIEHFAGRVKYSIGNFQHHNRDLLPDDLVCTFVRHNCNFGFLNYLFTNELKVLQEKGSKPRGLFHRISPPPNTDASLGPGSLSEDFHNRLDGLLKLLIHTRPHFIRCLKSNDGQTKELFDRVTIVEQIRSYQFLETLHLMAAGFPHRMKYRTFNLRYRCLLKSLLGKPEDKSYTESKLILDHFLQILEADDDIITQSSAQWALGKKHIFLSESARQQLERLRWEQRYDAATRIQAQWRCHQCGRRWPSLKRQLQLKQRQPMYRANSVIQRESENTWDLSESQCDDNVLKQTFNVYGLDMDRPPLLPGSRGYTVQGNVKMNFPQTRVMKQTYTDMTHGCRVFHKGEDIMVVGSSGRRGYLQVQHDDVIISVPFQLTQLKAEKSASPTVSSETLSQVYQSDV